MKKTYESPSVEKIAFQYRDQVVVASGNIPTANDLDPNNVDVCTKLQLEVEKCYNT